MLTDDYFMRKALQQAQMAFDTDEVPVGAVIVADQQIIAQAHNQTQQLQDVTAHAEILAITAAANQLGAKYLHQATLYVTLEPCLMCAGALAWSQIDRIVYGASDSKKGFQSYNTSIFSRKCEIVSGILANESKTLLETFFKNKRRS